MGQTFDISVRVSRSDERGYSDKNQESAARKLIEQRGARVGIVLVEKNVSGGTVAERRGIEKLVQRIVEAYKQHAEQTGTQRSR